MGLWVIPHGMAEETSCREEGWAEADHRSSLRVDVGCWTQTLAFTCFKMNVTVQPSLGVSLSC